MSDTNDRPWTTGATTEGSQGSQTAPERTPRPRPTLADAIRTFKDKIRHGENCNEDQCDCAASLNWAILDAHAARAEEEAGQRAELEQAVKDRDEWIDELHACLFQPGPVGLHTLLLVAQGIARAAVDARQGAQDE